MVSIWYARSAERLERSSPLASATADCVAMLIWPLISVSAFFYCNSITKAPIGTTHSGRLFPHMQGLGSECSIEQMA